MFPNRKIYFQKMFPERKMFYSKMFPDRKMFYSKMFPGISEWIPFRGVPKSPNLARKICDSLKKNLRFYEKDDKEIFPLRLFLGPFMPVLSIVSDIIRLVASMPRTILLYVEAIY